jgi:hypothetical protein
MNDTQPSRIKRFDTLATGIISGLLLPVIVYFIMYYSELEEVRYTIFSHHLVIGNIIPIIISHCVLPNLLLFFVFNGLSWIQSAKGILGSTVALTIIIFAIKLIFTIL